ncbi:MAG: hypothetical protein ACRDAU_07185 [Clostridium sp.]
MNNCNILGVIPFNEDITKPLTKFICKDSQFYITNEIVEINKIYIYSKSIVNKTFFSTIIDSVAFIYGDFKIKIEFLNSENKLNRQTFSIPFSEEISLGDILDENTNSNIDIDVTININKIFYKILNKNTVFFSIFSTFSLEFI